MVKLTANEYQEKHARNLIASIPDIERGIERVTEAPGKAAGKKVKKMRANLLASIDDGTWQKRVEGVTLEEWKAKAKGKGLQNIAGGIEAAKDKVVKFAEVLLPHVEAGQRKVKGMPDATLSDSGNRMLKFMTHMADMKYKKK